MAKYDCEVCRGRGTVRHALYKRTPIDFRPDTSPAVCIETSYRDYPCPECSVTAPESRVAFIEYHSRVSADVRIADAPEYMRSLSRETVMRLADKLMQDGLITVTRGPVGYSLSFPLTASIAVVSPAHRETMEQRIARGMEKYESEFMGIVKEYFGTWQWEQFNRNIQNKRANTVKMELKQS